MNTEVQLLTAPNVWQTLLFSLGIFFIVLTIRKLLESSIVSLKTKKWWTDGILPCLPIILGGVVALLARKYPFPFGITTKSYRILFGVAAGGSSGWIYATLKKWVTPFLAKEAPQSDNP